MAKKPKLPSKLSQTLAFGPPPVLEKEDFAAYDGLLANVSKTVEPRNILEEIWIRDIADNSWDVFRWRRLMANLLGSDSLANCIDHIERLDRLAMTAEARRNAALRELDRHRTSLAQKEIQEAENVEFELVEVIEPKDSGQKKVT